MLIEWYGHSAFKLITDNYSIFLDPFENGSVPGFKDICTTADYVSCSHEHFDHNSSKNINITPKKPPKTLRISHLPSWHDHHQGAHRGPNNITIIESKRIKIIHLGDLGEVIKTIDPLLLNADVLLIPVGGKYTISAQEAFEVIDKLKPRIIIPMHYHNKADGSGFEDIDDIGSFKELNKTYPYTLLNSNQLMINKDLSGIYQFQKL